jgi:plasmid stabilization system protein ParE
MTFHVRMLRRANADFANIVAYLHERSPQGAAAWVNAFEKAKVRLSENADCCPEADENHRHAIEVRQALFKTRRGRIYRLLFTSSTTRYEFSEFEGQDRGRSSRTTSDGSPANRGLLTQVAAGTAQWFSR